MTFSSFSWWISALIDLRQAGSASLQHGRKTAGGETCTSPFQHKSHPIIQPDTRSPIQNAELVLLLQRQRNVKPVN